MSQIFQGNSGTAYELTEKIDEGGFAFVHKARRLSDGKTVAVKLLKTDYSLNEIVKKKFWEEGKTLLALDHEHILKVHDLGSNPQGLHFLVSDLMDDNLESYIHGRKELDSSRAQQIVIALAEALDYAHSRGIIHRDVHPRNILLGLEDRVVLSDFGMAGTANFTGGKGKELISGLADEKNALSVQAGKKDTFTDLHMGVLQYIAPEIWSNHSLGRASEKSDQYSLGKIAYELFLRSGDRRFSTVCKKAMQVLPEDRYKSMKEFIVELKSIRDYLGELRNYRGRSLVSGDIVRLCETAEKACRENPENRPMFNEVLIAIEKEQLIAYQSQYQKTVAEFSAELARNFGEVPVSLLDKAVAGIKEIKTAATLLEIIESLAGSENSNRKKLIREARGFLKKINGKRDYNVLREQSRNRGIAAIALGTMVALGSVAGMTYRASEGKSAREQIEHFSAKTKSLESELEQAQKELELNKSGYEETLAGSRYHQLLQAVEDKDKLRTILNEFYEQSGGRITLSAPFPNGKHSKQEYSQMRVDSLAANLLGMMAGSYRSEKEYPGLEKRFAERLVEIYPSLPEKVSTCTRYFQIDSKSIQQSVNIGIQELEQIKESEKQKVRLYAHYILLNSDCSIEEGKK